MEGSGFRESVDQGCQQNTWPHRPSPPGRSQGKAAMLEQGVLAPPYSHVSPILPSLWGLIVGFYFMMSEQGSGSYTYLF